jgi:site-specific DNA recombinase
MSVANASGLVVRPTPPGKTEGSERCSLPTVTRAVIYGRISEDPLGLERGVGRQVADAEALAASRGWEVVARFVDNDVSALRGAHRPGYRALLDAVTAGGVDVIVVYMTSRLWRNRRERAEAIEQLCRARVSVAAVKGPELDLTTAAGRMLAGILGEMDTHESEVKGERVARAALQRAQEGRANGAALYGWRREYDVDGRGRVVGFRDVADPAEAAVVREIVARLLAGEPLKAVADDMNDRGLPSPNGKTWLSSGVRKVALRPANIALRVHGGQVVGQASWPAIVDADVHERVCALLTSPHRRTSRDGRRRHLLSYGVGVCGVCGAELRVQTRGGHELYVCDTGAGCVGRRRERVDDYVRDVVVGRLSRPDAAGLLVADDGPAVADRAEAETLRARLDTAADSFAAGAIDGDQLRRITASLRPQLDAVERRLRAATQPELGSLYDVIGEDAGARWDALAVGRRHVLLEALGVRVAVLPTRQGPGFDPASVRVEWPSLNAA